MFNLRAGLLGTPMGSAYGNDFSQGASGEMNGAGMDAMGSLKKYGEYGTRFAQNPTGGSQMFNGFNGFGQSAGMNYGGM